MDKISVIIPTCNRPELLMRAVRSIQSQTYRNMEIIIVNDGDDKLYKEDFNKMGNIPLFVYQNDKKKGGSGARNSGILKSTGTYIAFLDDDDEWLPNTVETLLKTIKSTKAILCYGGKNIIHEQGKTIKAYSYNRPKLLSSKYAILVNNFIGSTSSVMVRKDCFESSVWFDESLTVLQDYDLFIRICNTGPVVGINTLVVNYYINYSHLHISVGIKGFWKAGSTIIRKNRFRKYSWLLTIGLLKIYCIKIIKSTGILRPLFSLPFKLVRYIRQ